MNEKITAAEIAEQPRIKTSAEGSVKWKIGLIAALIAAGCGETVNPPQGSRFCYGGPCPGAEGSTDGGTGGTGGADDGTGGEGGMAGYAGEGGMAGYAGEGGMAGYAGEGGMAGYAGQGGMAGYAGEGGVSGYAGQGGMAGYAGEGGTAGYAGQGGTGGLDGGVGGTGGTGGDSGTEICSPEEKLCDGKCVDPKTDKNNCGDCNVDCDTQIVNSICVSGNCGCYPDAGLLNCEGTCVKFLEDEQNCGGCDEKCATDEFCINGNCI